MTQTDDPNALDLPSSRRLLIATGIAFAIAVAVLTTVVLPAEYGVDPTRIGSVLGLTEQGRLKRQQAQDEASGASEPRAPIDGAIVNITPPAGPLAAPIEAPPAVEPEVDEEAASVPEAPTIAPTTATPAAVAEPEAPASRSDRTSLTLAPGEFAEVKMVMRSGAQASFTWSTDGPEVNYDTHGDGSGVTYHGYGKGTAARQSGTITAAFDGHHGWFWRNRSEEDATITLQTSGDYESVDFVE